MKRARFHAREVAAALVLGGLATSVALAQTANPIQGVPGIQMPSPLPQPTISGTPIPYPAYGTPAPDVAKLRPRKGVPESISLRDAIRIGVALSPAFANQNAQWAAIHAKYTSELQALYPSVSGNAQAAKSYTNGTTSTSSSPTPGAAAVPAIGGVLSPGSAPAPTKPPFGVYSAS